MAGFLETLRRLDDPQRIARDAPVRAGLVELGGHHGALAVVRFEQAAAASPP
jgi:hypothetical protein